MYVVEVNRHSVICQTPEAVHALTNYTLNGHSNGAIKRRPGRRKTKAGKVDRRSEGTKAAWDRTRRVAAKLGRTDLMNVRSEIVAGKHKGD